MNDIASQYRYRAGKNLLKKSTLAACIAAISAQSLAQQAEPTTPSVVEEEVVVFGIRQSLQTAQDIRRDANTVKDVITASDIGSLPDKSIVEALQRVPGVAIERFEASDDPDHFSVEGGNVTVRGLNRVRGEFNGRDGFSASGDGGLNFSDIPPELVGGVEVSKNATADMTEGGIAGTINLITRKPFDSDDLVLVGTVRGSYGTLIDEVTPSFAGVASNVWDTDIGRFGALVSLSASRFSARGDGVGVFNYYNPNTVDGVTPDGNLMAPHAGAARQQFNERDRLGFAASLQWANPTETVQATLEYIRSDSKLSWSERFIEFPMEPFDNNAQGGNLNLSDATFTCPDDHQINNAPCRFTSGLIQGNFEGNDPYYVAGSRARSDQRVIDDISFNLRFTPNDNLTITGDLQYTEATNEITDLTAHGRLSGADSFLDLRHRENARFEVLNNDFESASSYFMRSAMDHASDNFGDQAAFQLDAEYTFDAGLITGVKAGVRVSQRNLQVRESIYNWGSIADTWMNEGVMLPYSEYGDVGEGFVEQFTFRNHLKGNSMRVNDTFWFPSDAVMSSSQELYRAISTDIPTGEVDEDGDPVVRKILFGDGTWMPLHERDSAIEGTSFRPSEIAEVEEDRSAVYVRLDFGSEDTEMRFSGNVGLRYVNWQTTSTGANLFGDAERIIADETSYFLDPPDWQEYNQVLTYLEQDRPNIRAENLALREEIGDYLDQQDGERYSVQGDTFSRVLPSFNLKLELHDDVILRLAASETIFMPSLNLLRNSRLVAPDLNVTREDLDTREFFDPEAGPVGEFITDVELGGYSAGGAGNPYLRPELSANYDVALEWYFSDFGSLTSTFFYKRVRDYFRQSSTVEELTNAAGITNDVVVTNTQNAGVATIQGYELAYQSSFGIINEALENFGIQASYTFIDGSARDRGEPEFGGDPADATYRKLTFNNIRDLPLEGLSKHNSNLVLFYDNSVFQARAAYNWRSSYLLNSRDVIAYAPVFGESTGQLDASISMDITDNIRIGLEANNLLNEVTRTSILNEVSGPESVQYNQETLRTPRSYFVNDRRFALFLQASF